MSKGLKIFLIVMAIACGGGVVIVAAGFIFFNTKGADLVKNSGKIMQEGASYGKGKQDNACLTHLMKRSEGCGELDLKCQVNGVVYMQACLQAATPTTGLCKGVPPESKLMESVRWRVAVCKTYPKVKPRVCQSMQAIIQKHCAKRGTRKLSLR